MDLNLLDPNSQKHNSRDEDFEGIDAQTVYEGSRETAKKCKYIDLLPKGAPQNL